MQFVKVKLRMTGESFIVVAQEDTTEDFLKQELADKVFCSPSDLQVICRESATETIVRLRLRPLDVWYER
jgi:hypothetical protein